MVGPRFSLREGEFVGGLWGQQWEITSLTALRVLSDERRAVCGRLCPAGPQLAAGYRRRPAARRSLREEGLHPGWLHADSGRQVTGTFLFGVERWGFSGALPSHRSILDLWQTITKAGRKESNPFLLQLPPAFIL